MSQTLTSPVERLLAPFAQCLNAEVVQQLANFQVDDATEASLHELAQKANDGQLTAAERAEYEQFANISDVITLLQIKARQRLKLQGG